MLSTKINHCLSKTLPQILIVSKLFSDNLCATVSKTFVMPINIVIAGYVFFYKSINIYYKTTTILICYIFLKAKLIQFCFYYNFPFSAFILFLRSCIENNSNLFCLEIVYHPVYFRIILAYEPYSTVCLCFLKFASPSTLKGYWTLTHQLYTLYVLISFWSPW